MPIPVARRTARLNAALNSGRYWSATKVRVGLSAREHDANVLRRCVVLIRQIVETSSVVRLFVTSAMAYSMDGNSLPSPCQWKATSVRA